MKQLHIAKNLSLPLDFATKTVAILAQRRKGKTYTASVIAEEMVAAKQPFVALDPTGAWWGLRASADGKSDGLPVVILGGQHGDVPLERTGGRLVADLVVDEPGYYVIDFSLFESGAAERQFAIDFAERLYRAKGQVGKDFALHLFVDEADRFVPQQLRKGSNETNAALLGAFEAIVRRGGLRGLGTTLISQRAAVVNKNVLEMLDILIALRTLGPNDRKAIEGYIEAHGTGEEREALMSSIGSLAIGEAWIWEPGAEPSLFERVSIRERRTFNSSATPKPGERRAEPRRVAAIDLQVLSTRMAATIEKAKAEDPRELNKIIAGLKREITGLKQNTQPREQDTKRIQELTEQLAAERAKVKPAGKAEVKEKKIVVAGDLTRLEAALSRGESLSSIIEQFTSNFVGSLGVLRNAIGEAKELNAQQLQVAAPSQSLKVFEPGFSKPSAPVIRPREATGARSIASGNGSGDLSPLHRQILNGIALLHNIGEPEPTIAQVGAVIGKSHNAGRIRGGFNQVHEMGYAEISGNKIRLTPTGSSEAVALDIRSRTDIHNLWYQRLNGNELEFLRVLINEFPTSVSLPDLGAAIGKDINAGRIRGALNALFEKGLATLDGDAVTASSLLFPAGLA